MSGRRAKGATSVSNEIDKLLAKEVERNRLTAEAASEARARMTFKQTLAEGLKGADFFVEAVPEVSSLKESIFAQLPDLAGKDTVLASNTSSISITGLAARAVGASERVVGFHMFNPVPVMRGVEIISGLQTTPETVNKALELAASMGKEASVSADRPGFIANKLLLPYINHAVTLLEQGVGDRDSIDNIMRNGCNMPMGPLALADLIGIDTCLFICEEIGEPPANLLRKYVDAGWLGRKSGRGFYQY